MSSSSLRNVLVPTVLASSVVFYALTSAFTLVTSRSVVEPPPLPSGRLQYTPSKEYKDFAIRNVGLCILASVGAGLVVAEIMRRKHAASQTAQSKQPAGSQPTSLISGIQPVTLASLPPEIASMVSQAMAEEAEAAENDLLDSDATDADTVTDFVSPFQVNQPQHTCRVRIPNSEQSLLAIVLEGDYYTLVKAEADQEKALGIVARLCDRGDRAVITQTANRYAIWTWQPYAEPCVQETVSV